MAGRLATALILVCSCAPAWSATPPPVAIEHIGAQLLYSGSGTLSRDIAPPATFSGWNTVIGEGDAKGSAADVLVSVTLTTPSDELALDTPLTVSARTAAGKVTITATLGRQTRSATLALDCGE